MHTRFGLGWRQVGCCFVLLAANSFIASAYSIVAVPLAGEFHPSRMVLMLAMTIMAGLSALISPFVGAQMDRVSLRGLMLLGAGLLSIGYVALSFTASFTQVLAVFGLLIAPANVMMGPLAATVLLARWFNRRQGRAVGIAVSGIAMGSIVFPPIVQWLLDHYEWRTAIRLFSLVLLACTVPAAALVIDRPSDRGLHPDGAVDDPAPAGNRAPARVPTRAILGDPAFWMAAATFAIVLSGLKGMMTNLAPMALDRGISGRDAAFLISIYGACGFVAKITFATVADRLNPRLLMAISLVGFASGMIFLAQAGGGYGALGLGVALAGLFGGLMVPLQSLLVPRIFGREIVGRAMGLISMAVSVALLTSPPLFGRIFDVTGGYAAIFLTFAALAAAMLLAVRYLRLQPRPVLPATALTA